MSWYAIDAIDEAIETTRSFLFPFEIGRWLRLAVIVFFLGSVSPGNVQLPNTGSADVSTVPWEDNLPLLIGIGLILLALFVLFGLISSVMQFVLLDSIDTDSIHIRRYFRKRLGKGVRLFLFEIGVAVVGMLSFVLVIAGGFTVVTAVDSILILVLSVFVLILLFFVVALLLALLVGFTTSFVAPVMIVEDCGVLDGWRRFWPTLTGEWKQYVLYVVINWFLTLAAGILVWIAMALLVLILGLVAGIPTALAFAFSEEIGLVLVSLFGLVGILITLVSVFLIQIPVKIYFRYYSLLVLRKTNDAFDLIPYFDADDSASESTAVGE